MSQHMVEATETGWAKVQGHNNWTTGGLGWKNEQHGESGSQVGLGIPHLPVCYLHSLGKRIYFYKFPTWISSLLLL